MSSRLEKRFAQASTARLADPLVVSGVAPHLVHELKDSTIIQKVVESVIREQWRQIHPDLAPSSAERLYREKNLGELEAALQQLNSPAFPKSLEEFRNNFPNMCVSVEPPVVVDSFSTQFNSLDLLLQQGHKRIPLMALRDVTLELFDLPRLAKEIDREILTSPAIKSRNFLRQHLLRSPETLSFENIYHFTLGATSNEFRDTVFGPAIYGRVALAITESNDPGLKPLLALFRPELAEDSDFEIFSGSGADLVTSNARTLCEMWNRAVMESVPAKLLDHFIVKKRNFYQQHVLDSEVSRVRDLARDIPLKRLYIDSSGLLREGTDYGHLHAICKVKAEQIIYRDDQDAPEASNHTVPQADGGESLIDRIVYAALEGRVRPSLSIPLQSPHSAVLVKLNWSSTEAVRQSDKHLAPSARVQGKSASSTSKQIIPGCALQVDELAYGTMPAYPPTIPAGMLTDPPGKPPTVPEEAHLLTSHRTDESGKSFFYFEGLIHRIYRGR
jgi:hypothetical protein